MRPSHRLCIWNKLRCYALAASLVLVAAAAPRLCEAQVTLPIKWANCQVFFPQSVSLSNDGNWVAVGGNGGAALYNRKTRTLKNLEPLIEDVFQVSFSSDSRTLALTTIVNNQNATELWNVADGKLEATLPTPSNSEEIAVFAPGGSTLAVGGPGDSAFDGIQLWDTETRKVIQSFSLGGASAIVQSVAFSKNGRLLSAGGGDASGGLLKIWDRTTGETVTAISVPGTDGIAAVALSPDGTLVAACGGVWTSPWLNIWDVKSGKLNHSMSVGADTFVTSVAFSPDGKSILTGSISDSSSVDAKVQLWDVGSGHQTLAFQTLETQRAPAVAYSADGATLASVGIGGEQATVAANASLLELWTPQGTSLDVALTAATTVKGPVAFMNNGTALAVPGLRQGMTSTANVVDLYEAQTGRWLGATKFPEKGSVTATAFSPTQNLAAISGTTDTKTPFLDVIEPISGVVVQSFNVSSIGVINSMIFSPNGTELIVTTGSSTSLAYVCGIGSKGEPEVIQRLSGVQGVAGAGNTTVAFSTLNGSTPTIELWDLKTQRVVSQAPVDLDAVLGLAVSPDGRTLAMEGCDIYSEGSGQSWQQYAVGYIELWDVATSTRTQSLGGYGVGVPLWPVTNALAFSPDGQYLIGTSTSNNIVSLVDMSIQPLWNGSITSMAFSPDGSLVASGPWFEEGVSVSLNPLFGLVVPTALTPGKPNVVGGGTVSATIRLKNAAPAKGAILHLSSSDAHAAVPISIIVPVGQKEATFQVQTQKVSSKTSVKISASAGIQTVSGTLVIL